MSCPFCDLSAERIIRANEHALALRDAFPVTPGHSLIVPRRHVASWFEIDSKEREDLLALVDWAKEQIDQEFEPDDYNIGINDGPAAGQTIPHLHIHLIPRYHGDKDDPRGGVRWVIPEKATYWK